MKHPIHHAEPEAEYYSLDDTLPVWPDDPLHPVLPYTDLRLLLHVGHCAACRRDSARTVRQATACMARRFHAVSAIKIAEGSA